MDDLSHSAKALDTLRLFHDVTFVVFVEGQDDLPYWDGVLSALCVRTYHLKVAGCSDEVEKCCHAIKADNADIAVARDADLLAFYGATHDHPRILYTYGYSIENSILGKRSVCRMLQALVPSADDFTELAETWFDGLGNSFRPLIELDIANQGSGKGLQVPLLKFPKFACLPNCGEPRPERIRDAVTSLRRHIDEREHANAANLLSASTKPIVAHLRGHFLLSAVNAFLRQHVRQRRGRAVPLSIDTLFALAMAHFRVAEVPDDERQHLEGQVRRLEAVA